jgi:hypothetical protein
MQGMLYYLPSVIKDYQIQASCVENIYFADNFYTTVSGFVIYVKTDYRKLKHFSLNLIAAGSLIPEYATIIRVLNISGAIWILYVKEI